MSSEPARSVIESSRRHFGLSDARLRAATGSWIAALAGDAYHATRADLLRRLGRPSDARAAYEKAIKLQATAARSCNSLAGPTNSGPTEPCANDVAASYRRRGNTVFDKTPERRGDRGSYRPVPSGAP